MDYLLRYNGQMIAVLEAKDERHPSDAGLEQAKSYAALLDVPFAYSANGHAFVEFDFFENRSRELNEFPTPDELWHRWQMMRSGTPEPAELAAEERARYGADPLLHPFCPPSRAGKELRYFQEVAARRVIERAVRGQRRILLTMATGTGKTFTAFQIVWKLKKSGWLRKPVLFIADRNVLRDQAYNAFSPFVEGQSDPRAVIEYGRFIANRDLYFALYQALDADEGGEPLFRRIPRDFFGLIVIDECHRSGFGKWNEILRHFPDAIQFGMTATPKRDDNIDTYAYFCSEEPEIQIDPDDPSKGAMKPPAYAYSLGQGIDDGFLATYKVHKVRTSVDKDGLHVEDARVQGAEIYVPENAELRDLYATAQFEREITLPDRTRAMVEHLAGLLRRFDPKEKTIVFCVDMEHARLAARLLQNEFSHLGYPDYAVPIISEEGEAASWLERFQDSDRETPVVATTAELLSTGVDVPSCRNIVFMKPIASPVLFKQIVGRGSRVDPATGKEWFRVIDYVGASRLFDEWDRPPGEPRPIIEGPRTSILEGTVLDTETGALIVGASVSLQVAANEQHGPINADENGRFRFTALPAGTVRTHVRGTGFRPRSVSVETAPDDTTSVAVELRREEEPREKIRVRGLEVTIADEATFFVEATGERLTLSEYLDYTRTKVAGYVPDSARLHEVWIDQRKREQFLRGLRDASIEIEVLADVLARPEADQFDLLAHIAFGEPIRTRGERAEAFVNYEQGFMQERGERAREIIVALLDKYRLAGVGEMMNPEVFSLSPFREMGQMRGVARRLGGVEALKETLDEMQKRIYREETG